MAKIKIAFILQDFYIGGIQTCLANIASRLRNEFDCHFISTHVKEIHPRFNELGVTAYCSTYQELISYLHKNTFDIVQTHNVREYAVCAAAARVPVIIERVAGNRATGNSKEGIDWVIASNKGTVELIEKTFPRNKISVIYNGIDSKKIDSYEKNRLGFLPTDIIVGRISRIGRGQNLDMLIKAIVRIHSHMPQVKLVIVGDKSQMPGADDPINELKTLAQPLGRDVIFTGEKLDPIDILQGFDIATCVSTHEGIPNSLIEAMACQKAIVSTSVGQIPELIQNEHNGCLIPTGDEDALVKAIERLANDAAFRQRLGKQARLTIEQSFNIEIQAEKYSALYKTLLHDFKTLPRDKQKVRMENKFKDVFFRTAFDVLKGKNLQLFFTLLRYLGAKERRT